MVSEPVYIFWKGHSNEVGPGRATADRQKWTRDNFPFLRDHIVCHLTAKSEFRIPKASASQATAAASSASRCETMHMEPFQDTSCPESTDDPADLSNLDKHTPTPKSHCVSVTSSNAESDQLDPTLAQSQRGITALKDIVVKKLIDDKPENPNWGFGTF